MRATLIMKDTQSEITTEKAICIACCPLGAFTIVTSDTHMVLQVTDKRWRVPVADMVAFMQTHGDNIPCDYPSI